MRAVRQPSRTLGVVALLGAAAFGCSSVKQEQVSIDVPDRTQFPLVADALSPSCATLDCHGQVGRNFRMYWQRGLRLDPAAFPGEGETTPDEYDQTFRSLIALEPFKMDSVVKGTLKPDGLTLVRKGRGTEAHKGGARMTVGSDADRCLVTWLTGAIDTAACKAAAGKP